MLRGAVLGSTRDWYLKTYGSPQFNRALTCLDPEFSTLFGGPLVSVGWYPLDEWTRLFEAMHREACGQSGETIEQFTRRAVFDSARTTLMGVYRMVLGAFDPTTIIARVVPFMRRVYSHGTVEVVENKPGYVRLIFAEIPGPMLTHVRQFFPLATEFTLDLAKQRVTETRVAQSRDNDSFAIEVRMKYEEAPRHSRK